MGVGVGAEPWWPVVALAAFQAADGVACAIPIPFVVRALDAVNCPPTIRRVLPRVKWASAIGLIIGLWWTPLGIATGLALLVYFAVAFGFHIRARDTVANTIASVSMFLVTLAVLSCFA